MDYFNNNVQPQKKPLDIMFGILIITSVLIVSILIYSTVKYFDYQKLKRVVCDEHKQLKKNIDIINKNNNLLKNKKNQFSDYLSTNYENTSCIGEWGNCDNECKQVYTVNKPKNGDGEDCEFSDGQIRDCIDEGDCSPVDCVGYWSNCNENKHKQYNLTTPAQRGGKDCDAEDGALDRTSCPGAGTSATTEDEKTETKVDGTSSFSPKQLVQSILSLFLT
jgi:hypothetical protein